MTDTLTGLDERAVDKALEAFTKRWGGQLSRYFAETIITAYLQTAVNSNSTYLDALREARGELARCATKVENAARLFGNDEENSLAPTQTTRFLITRIDSILQENGK